ncbi:MAG: HEAT repeat domain-containing protein, partial [Desulfuromonadales bacterium]
MAFYRPPTTQGTLDMLGSVYRAIRAWRFYPKGHPTRRNTLNLAHDALLQLLDGNTLLLACGRTGFSFPDGESIKDDSGLSAALAYELFVRRVQKITFFPDPFQEDLLELFKILCLSPETIQQAGGMDAIMAKRGIRTIWVNEFDLAAIRSKRSKVEQDGVIPQGIDEAEIDNDVATNVLLQTLQAEVPTSEEQLQALLGRLTVCTDDDNYLILVRQAVACADELQPHRNLLLLFPLIEVLADHAGDESRSENMRECAQFAIEQIISTADVLPNLLERAGLGNELSNRALLAVIKAGGTVAITAAIELMGRTGNLKTRKTISTTLGKLGGASVPALLCLMDDSRWFIIRNICAILGAIASQEALTPLVKCMKHPDIRVRKEAIRSIAQIGGPEAEAAVLEMLHGSNTTLYPQLIASLGGMKSKKALAELLIILFSKDIFLKTLTLKIDVLTAIATIGDRQVTPHLVALLGRRYLLAKARGNLLKAAIVVCLGKLGDARAIPALRKYASAGSNLGYVCLEAIAAIEKTEGIS